MAAISTTRARMLVTPLAVALVAFALRLISGVSFANYDTLYALVWGQQLSRGQTPRYDTAIAPTPHPLLEALGFVLSPLGARATEDITVALGYLALAGCGWAVFRLGELWFGWAAGALGALLLLTRVPVLSYGVRAYADLPYLLLVLAALVVETRRRRAGTPVLALLGLAGLLRPEAWAFSGLYWLYLARGRTRSEMVRLAALVALAPLIWVVSDWLVTGHPLWSLTNTRDTAQTLGRETGIAKVPIYIPRRIGEVLGPAALVAAALGGVLSLAWLRDRARLGAWAGVAAVVVLAIFATAGLPIDTRYTFLASAVLCVFAGAGAFGWRALASDDPRRRWWQAGGALVVLALIAFIPHQYHSAHSQLNSLDSQGHVQNDLIALVKDGAITSSCEPIGVANHAPVPLLALYMHISPAEVVSAEQGQIITHGTYVKPASRAARAWILDPADPHAPTHVPAGFTLTGHSQSWDVYKRCR